MSHRRVASTDRPVRELTDRLTGTVRCADDKMIGTGAALKHFDETGKQYPLVVKLGTITPQVRLRRVMHTPL